MSNIQKKAARYVVELDNDGCSDARRARIQKWLAKDPRHQEVFNILRATMDLAARAFRERRLKKAH